VPPYAALPCHARRALCRLAVLFVRSLSFKLHLQGALASPESLLRWRSERSPHIAGRSTLSHILQPAAQPP